MLARSQSRLLSRNVRRLLSSSSSSSSSSAMDVEGHHHCHPQQQQQQPQHFGTGPLALYRYLVASKTIREDTRQLGAVLKLQEFHDVIHLATTEPATTTDAPPSQPRRTMWMNVLFWSSDDGLNGNGANGKGRGIYIYGGVGTGKTRVMVSFVPCPPVGPI